MIKTLLLNEADPANLETLLVDDAERADRESTGSSRAQRQSNKTTSNRVPGTGIFFNFSSKIVWCEDYHEKNGVPFTKNYSN